MMKGGSTFRHSIQPGKFSVHVTIDGETGNTTLFRKNDLPLNVAGISAPFSLQDLGQPRKDPYTVTCTAELESGVCIQSPRCP
jgi:hypothetical protein